MNRARQYDFRPIGQTLALEPRLLFDGAMATAAEHQQSHDSDGDSSQPTDHHPATSEPTTAPAQSASQHLLVLDSRLENREQLLNGLPGNVTVLVVQSGEDGLAAISAALAAMGQADSVQILSHGSAGQFSLGNQTFNASNLDSFSQTLQGWGSHLTADADIQLYGCDVGAGEAGQRLVNELATLTGADVAASSNDTGASAKGGDWNLEVRSGSIEQPLALSSAALSGFDALLANASPTVTFNDTGSDVLLGNQFTFTLNFDNSSSQPGYAPFVTVFMPASGKDGNDGASFVSASYMGKALSSQVVTFDSAGRATHPYALDASGQPVVINASTYGMRAGDQMVCIRIPFGSVSQDQPALPIVVTASLSNLADTRYSNASSNLTIRAIGGFERGNDALNNPTSDPSLLQGSTVSHVVRPTLINVSNALQTTESEVASGPNHTRTYTTTVQGAPGQVLTNVIVTQRLPDAVQVTAITPSAGGTLTSLRLFNGDVLTDPSAMAAAIASDTVFIREFSVRYANLTSTGSIGLQFYVPQFDASGAAVLDSQTGAAKAITLQAPTVSGTWRPTDTRDVTAPATTLTITGTGTSTAFTAKAITLLKDVQPQSDLGTPGTSPGDTLLFALKVAISDYFSLGRDTFGEGQFTVTDQLGDGLSLNNTPTLTVTVDGSTRTIALVTQQVANADGSTTLQFDIARSLQNAYTTRSWLNGDLSQDAIRNGATSALISYTALVGQSYTPPSGAPHSSINEGDSLSSSATVRASVMNGIHNQTGFEQSDSSSVTLSVPTGQAAISIASVNGSAPGAGVELKAGDLVTFRMSYDLVTGDYEQFSLTAYLPQPLFTVGGINWGSGSGEGQWQLGSANSNAGSVLSVTSGAGNSVIFDLGNHASNATAGSRVDVQFTLRVGNQSMADQRAESVFAQSLQQTTLTDATLKSSAVVALIAVAEPLLSIAHGVVSTSNGTVQGTSGTWRAPGSSGRPFTGTLTNLAAVAGRVSNIDGGDVLRLATAIENTGGAGAFDVSTRIDLPADLSFVGGSLASANLRVYLGNGTQLVAGRDFSVSGNQITFLDASGRPTLVDGRPGTANDTSGANLVVITYEATVATTVNAGRTMQSTATLTHYASADNGSDYATVDLSATANQQVGAPSVNIVYADGTLDESDSSAAHTTGSDLVVGESMTYDILVTLPEGSTQGLQVIGDVPNGMRVDLNFNGGLGYQIITSRAQSSALANDFNGSVTMREVTFPGSDGAGAPGANAINPRHYFDIASATADNVAGNNTFVLRLRLVASNSYDNRAGRSLPTTAYLQYADPDGSTPNGSTEQLRTVRTSTTLGATLREPVLQISQALTSTSDAGGYDHNDPLTFTITITNGNGSSDFNAFDISFSDTLPTELSDVVLQSVTFLGGATNNGGADFELVNGQLQTVAGANIDIAKGGSIVLRLSGVVNSTAADSGSGFSNEATVQWTSLDGRVSGERTGADGELGSGALHDYRLVSTLSVPVPAELILSRTGGLDTRTPSTTTAAVEQAAVGEIVRYRATVLIPEGTQSDYVLQFTLDNGLDLLTDSIRIAFVSNGGITSTLTLITAGTLNVTGDETHGLTQPITGDLSGVAPTGVLDPSRVQVTSVGGQQVVRISLGDISNVNDNDANLEYLNVEFNAQVLNQQSNTNGTRLGVSAESSVSTSTAHVKSDTLYEEVVEANFDTVTKTVVSFNPDASTAKIELSMTQDGNLPAYDVRLTDGFAEGSQYSLISLTIDGVTYGPGNLPTGVTLSTNGAISLDFTQIDAGTQITVVYEATLPTTGAIASTDATLTWSSLPETFTGWGGSSLGIDGSTSGERTGSGVGANTYIRTDDAGLGVISGTLWNDSNSATTSATPDGNGLSGVTVTLIWAGADGDLQTTADNLQFTTTTDSNGEYRFALLPSGLYRIDAPTTLDETEPLGSLKVRIDNDASTALGRVELNLGDAGSATADIGYVEQNAAPVNNLPGDLTVQEDTQLAITGLSISDADAERNPDSAQRELSVTLSVLHGTLFLSANPQSASVAGSNSTTLVLTGTLAQLNAALANLQYQGDTNYNGIDTLTVLTDDQANYGDSDDDGIPGQTTDALSTTDELQIEVTAVNDQPEANDDTATANEAGGELNQTAGSNPRGNLLDNDTDVDIDTNQDLLRIVSAGLDGEPEQPTPARIIYHLEGLYGTLQLSNTGAYEYVLDNDNADVQALRLSSQTLTEKFNYTVSDVDGEQSTATLTITIVGHNDAPVAVDDTGSATEAGGIANGTAGTDPSGNVLDNDSDVDSSANGETVHVTGIRAGRELILMAFDSVPGTGSVILTGLYGTLTIDAAGNYTYAVDNDNSDVQKLVAGTSLDDIFTYRITDASGASDCAELTITINGANDNPVASDDVAAAHAAASDDSTLESNPRGNLIWFPSRPGTSTQAGGNGIDSDVDEPDQPNRNLRIDGAINKTEANYDPLTDTMSIVTDAGTLITGNYGTLRVLSDGSYVYDVDSDNADVRALAFGQTLTETFTYRLVDTAGNTDTAQLVITVHGVNDPPLAQNVYVDAVEAGGVNNHLPGTNPSGDATANDTDHDNDTLTVTHARPGALADTGTDIDIAAAGTTVTGDYGTLLLHADGTFTYTVNNDNAAVQALREASDQLIERFTYTISDGQGGTGQAEIVVTISGQNDAPLADDDTATAVEAGGRDNTAPGTDPSGNVLSNDSDVDGGDAPADLPDYPYGETLEVTAIRTGSKTDSGTAGTVGSELKGSYGWLILNSDGSYDYRVDNSLAAVQALRSSTDTLTEHFTYTVTDKAGAQDSATLTITIQGANDAPEATDDTATATEAGGVDNATAGTNPTGNVLSNDTDVDAHGETLQVTGVSHGTLNGSVGIALSGEYGSLTLNADGSYSYVLDNSNAAVQALRTDDTLTETFTYRVADLAGATDTATLTITIQGHNDAPVAVDDEAEAVEAGGTFNDRPGGAANGNVLDNDTDKDANDSKTVDAVRHGSELEGGALQAVADTLTLDGLYGQLQIKSDGTYVYTVNDALAAVQALKAGESLTERFTYSVRDQAGASDLAQLTLTIQGAWDAPVAVDDNGYAVAHSDTGPGVVDEGNVLSNDRDVDDNDALTVTAIRVGAQTQGGSLTVLSADDDTVIDGLYGQLVIRADGSYSYFVDANNPDVIALGTLGHLFEHFTYQVSDGGNLSDLGQLTIIVRGGDHAPIAQDDSNVAADRTPTPQAQGNVLANDTDSDFDPLVDEHLQVTAIRTGAESGSGQDGLVGQVIQGRYGSLVLNANGSYSYIINLRDPQVLAAAGRGQVLQDLFTYIVTDIWGLSDQAQLTISLDISAPFTPAPATSSGGDVGLSQGGIGRPALGDVEPKVYIGPLVSLESSINELASWRSDGSRLDRVTSPGIASENLNQWLRPVPGQYVSSVVRQSSTDSDIALAWILGRQGRVDLSADGLLSNPSVFAPLPEDLLNNQPLPFYLQPEQQAAEPALAMEHSPATVPSTPEHSAAAHKANGFSAQLQAAARHQPPKQESQAKQRPGN